MGLYYRQLSTKSYSYTVTVNIVLEIMYPGRPLQLPQRPQQLVRVVEFDHGPTAGPAFTLLG